MKKKTTKELNEVVLVRWKDPHTLNGWRDRKANSNSTDGIFCQSVGVLLFEDKKSIKITQSITEHDDCSEILTITKACVNKITHIGSFEPWVDKK